MDYTLAENMLNLTSMQGNENQNQELAFHTHHMDTHTHTHFTYKAMAILGVSARKLPV